MITITPEMKQNPYYKSRKEIQRICRDNNVDVSVSSNIWAHRNGKIAGNVEDRRAWDHLLIQFQRDKTATLKDLFEG